MIENYEIMADNIKYYMELNKVSSTEVCKSLGFKQNTFSDWVNGKSYPRIDKIERLARYFGILKSDLVEKRNVEKPLSDHEWNIVKAYRTSPHKAAIDSLLGVSKGGDDS